jgi:hypothetical protein
MSGNGKDVGDQEQLMNVKTGTAILKNNLVELSEMKNASNL